MLRSLGLELGVSTCCTQDRLNSNIYSPRPVNCSTSTALPNLKEITSLTCHYRFPCSLKLLNNLVDILNTLGEVSILMQLRQLELKNVHSFDRPARFYGSL